MATQQRRSQIKEVRIKNNRHGHERWNLKTSIFKTDVIPLPVIDKYKLSSIHIKKQI